LNYKTITKTNFVQLLTYLSLVFTMFIWGGTFIAGRVLADSVPPANSAFLRFFIASIALVVMVKLIEKRFPKVSPRLFLPLFFLGLTGVFAYNVCFFFGLQHITAGRASLFIASTPLVITVLAAIFLAEKLTRLKVIGVLFSLTGAIIVISNGAPASLLSGGFGPGEKALIGCVLSWSAYSLVGRSVLTKIPPLAAVCYSSIIGTVLLFFPVMKNGLLPEMANISVQSWTSLAYLGILGTAVGFSLYYRSITKIGATRTAIFINLVPLFALVLAWLFLGESIKAMVLVGGTFILIGVACTNYQAPRKP
jgi:drug/metabolite transporter (DMT)-like permease